MDETKEPRGLAVINAGMYRTGTASMARAYEILGLRAHHGHDIPADDGEHWGMWEEAAEAMWPDVPGARRGPKLRRARWSREEWDRLLGPYDVVTDIGSLFAEALIEAYPDARVVVVERDRESWLPSFERGVAGPIFTPINNVFFCHVVPVVAAVRKILLGGFGAHHVRELRDRRRLRNGYTDYYRRVRAAVPAARRLEYRLGDGWEPLCAFLDVPVPDVPFPRVNEAAEHELRNFATGKRVTQRACMRAGPWIAGALFFFLLLIFAMGSGEEK